jgi:pimeloyl-ACP methyl ester carboxylesterase
VIARWWHGPKRGGELWHKDRWVRSFDNTKIRYTLLGRVGKDDAPTVVLCAGFVCPDTYWKYLVPALCDSHRVLVWNYRGIGVSELPRPPGFHAYAIADEDLTIEANARDLEIVMHDAGIERATLIGHSMGVQVVLEAYRRYPNRVDAMVCIAGPYRTPLRTFYRTDLSARLMPIALPLLHALPRVTLLGWRALLRNPFTYPAGVHIARAIGPRASREDMEGYFEHLSMLDPLIAAKMVRGMHAHSAEDVLAKIDVPVLILHGTADPFTPLSIAQEMAAEIPNAKLVVYEGGAHTLPIEYHEEIGAEVNAFLTKALTRS